MIWSVPDLKIIHTEQQILKNAYYIVSLTTASNKIKAKVQKQCLKNQTFHYYLHIDKGGRQHPGNNWLIDH